MPGNLLTISSTVVCPHGGVATAVPGQSRVLVQQQPVLTEADTHIVAGCPFNIASAPNPCVTIRWSAGSARAQASGVNQLTQSSVGICYSAANAPQGLAVVAQTQPNVFAL